MLWRALTPPDSVDLALSRGVGRCGWLVGCLMAESRHCGAFVGMVVAGRGASWCRQPMGRRSRFDPCMPCWFGVGRLACGLFIVGSFFLQQFGWYPVVSAALWSAVAPWGRLRCSPRRCSRMLSWLSSRLVRRFVVAGLSDVAVVVRPGRARRVVLVHRCRGRQWSARPELCGGLYGPGWHAFCCCRLSPTLFVSRRACFVVVCPVRRVRV